MWGGCGGNVAFVPINSPQILCPPLVNQHQQCRVGFNKTILSTLRALNNDLQHKMNITADSMPSLSEGKGKLNLLNI